jgi:hypothetical protein
MRPFEYLTKGAINIILLSMPTWDFIDPVLKFCGAVAGLVLTIFLVRKAWYDTELAREQKRKLQLENDQRNHELYLTMEKSKRFRK